MAILTGHRGMAHPFTSMFPVVRLHVAGWLLRSLVAFEAGGAVL